MEIEANGTIYDGTTQDSQRRVAFFPALYRTSRDAWISTFQVGSSKHALNSVIGLCRSGDGGSSWQQVATRFNDNAVWKSGSFAAAELTEDEDGQLLIFATWFDRSDPSRPIFDPQGGGILHTKQLRAQSRDEGETWSNWEEVPTPGLTGCSLTGPLLEWSDKSIALTFESQQTFDSLEEVPHAAWLMASDNRGNTFSEPRLVATHPEGTTCYWDQRLCPTNRAGEYIAAFWTHDRKQQQDLSVHLRRGSLDNAFESHTIRSTGLHGQIAAPLCVGDDQLLLFVVDRGRPGTLRLHRSRDFGATWPREDCFTIYTHDEQASISQGATNIDYAAYWEDMGKWTFGHPVIRRLDSTHVLLSYYAGTPSALSIHWARVRI